MTTEERKIELELELHQLLRVTGRIVPQTAEEVAQAESLLDEESVQLPARLLTPPTGPSQTGLLTVEDLGEMQVKQADQVLTHRVLGPMVILEPPEPIPDRERRSG